MKVRHFVTRAATISALAVMSIPVQADHSWADYHWARKTASFDLVVINSTTSDWDLYVKKAILDWSKSDYLNMVEDPDGSTNSRVRRKCKGGSGTVRICNLAYGKNGWLGIAGISIDSDGHITTGYTKLNDSYFTQAYYNKDDWKQSVTCQELGHNVGLGHQDEIFDNDPLKSCMDYQDPPFESPNEHDYDQLEAIYGRSDLTDSYAGGGDSGGGGDDGGTCKAPKGKGCNKAGDNDHNRDIGWGHLWGAKAMRKPSSASTPMAPCI